MSFKNVTEKLQFIDSTILALIETARPLGDDLYPLQVGARLFRRLASEMCVPREEAHRSGPRDAFRSILTVCTQRLPTRPRHIDNPALSSVLSAVSK